MRPAARTRASPTKNNTVQRPTRGTRRASQSARVQWPAPPLPSRLVDHENDPARYVLLQGTATLLYRRMNHSALWFSLLTYSKFTTNCNAVFNGKQNIQHPEFPRGPPPQYYLGPMVLDFRVNVRMGSGIFTMV